MVSKSASGLDGKERPPTRFEALIVVSLLLIVLSILFMYSAFFTSPCSLIFFIFPLLILVFLIMAFLRRDRRQVIIFSIAFILLFGISNLLWSLSGFDCSPRNLVTTGFVKINPLSPSIYYRGTNFTASFRNQYGTPIKINSITLNETIAGSNCTSLEQDPSGTTIMEEGIFTVKALGCPERKIEDFTNYDMMVKIEYNTTMGGITVTRIETGHIKGQVEFI